MSALRRSPRAGWTLVSLCDGAWRVELVGDRDAVQHGHNELVRPMLDGPLHHPGECAVMYDAHGQLRDAFPRFPRLADGTRVEVPSAPPADGAVPVPRVVAPRAS